MAEKKRWRATTKTRVKKSRLDKVKEDTRNIKNGERRRGPNGKMNVYYNGRWYAAEKVEAGRTPKGNKVYGKKSNTSATVSSAKKAPAPSRPKNLGLGGSAAPYKRPGRKPAQEKVVNVKIDPKDARGARTAAALRARESAKSPKKIPIGRIVLRGNPPKKYKWNGTRFERYTGPREPKR